MKSKFVFWLLTTVLLTTAPPAQAQQPTKIPRIGYLGLGSLSANTARPRHSGTVCASSVRGGENIVIEWRFAEGKVDRLTTLAAELVRLKVDVIVTAGATNTRPPRKQLSRCPCHDAGWRSCRKRVRRQPCATWWQHYWTVQPCPRLSGKRLELLKEIVTKLSRVAVLGTQPTRATHQR